MTLSLAAKAIIIYLCIGVVLAAAGIDNSLSDQLTDGDSGVSTQVEDTVPNVDSETGSASGILAFIDALRAVRNFIVFMGTVLVALPATLLDLAVPEVVRLVIGVPFTIVAIIGIVQFARSGQ